MRTKTSLLMIILGLMVPAGAGAEVLVLDASIHKNDTVSVHAIEQGNGSVKKMTPDGSYSVLLLDDEDQVLYEDSFYLGFTTTYFRRGYLEGNASAEYITTETERRLFRLPLYTEAETVEIRKDQETILERSLVENLCTGDGMCSTYCRSDDRWNQDPDCEEPQETTGGGFPIIRLVVALVFIAAAISIYVKGIRGRDREEMAR